LLTQAVALDTLVPFLALAIQVETPLVDLIGLRNLFLVQGTVLLGLLVFGQATQETSTD